MSFSSYEGCYEASAIMRQFYNVGNGFLVFSFLFPVRLV